MFESKERKKKKKKNVISLEVMTILIAAAFNFNEGT